MLQHQVLVDGVCAGYQLKEGDLLVRKAFGTCMRFSLLDEFPLDRNDSVVFTEVVAELLWLLSGSSSNLSLNELGSHRRDHAALRRDEIELQPKTPNELVTELAGVLSLDPRLVGNMLSMADQLEPPSEDPSVTLSGARRLLVEKGISLDHEITRIPQGSLGQTEGVVWRDCDEIDQITALIEQLRDNPMGRPHILIGWDVGSMYEYERGQHQLNVQCGFAAEEPRIPLMQFLVREMSGRERALAASCKGIFIPDDLDSIELINLLDEADIPRLALDCCVYQQRGNPLSDVPFVTAVCALLIELLARSTGMGAGKLNHFVGETWMTEDEIQSLDPQTLHKPSNCGRLHFTPSADLKETIFDLTPEDIELI